MTTPAGDGSWMFSGETNFDPCADLSYAMADTPGATASSPWHIMLFHRGEYLGTASKCAQGFTTVTDSGPDRIDVRHRWPVGNDPHANPTGLAERSFAWDGDRVQMIGTWPDALPSNDDC